MDSYTCERINHKTNWKKKGFVIVVQKEDGRFQESKLR